MVEHRGKNFSERRSKIVIVDFGYADLHQQWMTNVMHHLPNQRQAGFSAEKKNTASIDSSSHRNVQNTCRIKVRMAFLQKRNLCIRSPHKNVQNTLKLKSSWHFCKKEHIAWQDSSLYKNERDHNDVSTCTAEELSTVPHICKICKNFMLLRFEDVPVMIILCGWMSFLMNSYFELPMRAMNNISGVITLLENKTVHHNRIL